MNALTLALLLTLPAQAPPKPAQAPPKPAQQPPDGFQPDPARKELYPNIWFDPKDRRLIARAHVCLREGYLEHLLCLRNSKEHESILAIDDPNVVYGPGGTAPKRKSSMTTARALHAGLILTAGEPGHHVVYRPEFQPPKGPSIGIELLWKDARGQMQKADARQWVKDEHSGKPLDTNWVFAGSDLFQNPETKRVIYAADSGDLITVANFPSAILDLPFASSNSDAERGYVAFTDHVPPLSTPVTMIFRAIKDKPAETPKTP